MNETAMKPCSAFCPKSDRTSTNIPVEVYTCGEVFGITQVTAPGETPIARNRGRQVAGRLWVMKAIVISRLGGPEVLEIRDAPDPVPSAGLESVRVQAGGLNFADFMTAQGGYPGTPAPPLIAGREFAGVEEISRHRVMGYIQ